MFVLLLKLFIVFYLLAVHDGDCVCTSDTARYSYVFYCILQHWHMTQILICLDLMILSYKYTLCMNVEWSYIVGSGID